MHLVDEDGPQDHRQAARHQAHKRGIGPVQPGARARQIERGGNIRKGAAECDPSEQAGKADKTNASGNIATRTIGAGGGVAHAAAIGRKGLNAR